MILKRKNQKNPSAPPVPPTDIPNRVTKLSDVDLFLLAESSILSAGHYLTMYRTSAGEEAAAALEWAISNMYTGQVACAELQERDMDRVAMQ